MVINDRLDFFLNVVCSIHPVFNTLLISFILSDIAIIKHFFNAIVVLLGFIDDVIFTGRNNYITHSDTDTRHGCIFKANCLQTIKHFDDFIVVTDKRMAFNNKLLNSTFVHNFVNKRNSFRNNIVEDDSSN